MTPEPGTATTASAVDPFAPAQLGPITIRNRFIKAATFEGMADDNMVTDRLIDYHRAVCEGGVGMTTLAYNAVSPDGQGAPMEIVVNAAAAPGLKRFVEMVHGTGAAANIQLGHAGPVAAGTGHPPLTPSKVFSPRNMKFTQAATVEDLKRVIGCFADSAEICADVGFDSVELHFGHGYLPSSFMSPKLNKRTDEWGGSIENRARLARTIAEVVRERVGTRIAVIAKLNMADGVDKGLWLAESLQIGRMLDTDGHLDALELTGGSSFENPMYLFRGDAPIHEMADTMPQPIKMGFKLTAKKFLHAYPFEEAFFKPFARQFLDALDTPIILLGGITRLDTVNDALNEGFAFVSMGRALLREPELLNRWQAGDTAESLCVQCNKCMPSIYAGTHCVLVPEHERPGHRLTAV